MALLLRLLIIAAAFAVAEAVLSGMEVSGGFWTYLWIAVIFGVVNAIIGTILHILALPLTILVNALLLEKTPSRCAPHYAGTGAGRQVASPHPLPKYPQLASKWPYRWGDTTNPQKPLFNGVLASPGAKLGKNQLF